MLRATGVAGWGGPWGLLVRQMQNRSHGLFWRRSFVLKIVPGPCIFVKLFINPQDPCTLPVSTVFSQPHGRD